MFFNKRKEFLTVGSRFVPFLEIVLDIGIHLGIIKSLMFYFYVYHLPFSSYHPAGS